MSSKVINKSQLHCTTIINLLQRMSCSDQIVKKIYGQRLALKDNHRYTNHLFTLYEDTKTKEQYFLRTVQLPAFLHISEGITDLVTKKYQNLLPPTKIIPLEKTFQTHSYLLRVSQNIILLTNFLQIKGECSQVIQIEFFRKFLLFLLNSYQIIENGFLPLYGIKQIGINDSNEFTLCDPSLYFRQEGMIISNESFGSWIKKLLKQFFNLPLNSEQYQEIIKEKYESHFNILWPLINYLLTGNATFEGAQAKLLPVLGRMSEQVSTVTSSYMDLNDFFERGTKSSMKKSKAPFKKVGKFGKIMTILTIVAVLVGVSYFVFEFFNRKIVCEEGFYLSDLNQCVGCSEGCLRCEDSMPNKCMKCSVNMYLVLDDEEDKQGFCLKQCSGRRISIDVCIKQKKMFSETARRPSMEVNSPLRQEITSAN